MNGNPSDVLAALLRGGAVGQSPFGPESRYFGIPLAELRVATGETVRYVTRRFIPAPHRFFSLQRYRVMQGDRLDVIAARVYAEPLFYWRLCDANVAMRPDDLTAVPGEYIRVTLPAGIAGMA